LKSVDASGTAPRVRVVALGGDASASEDAWDGFVAAAPDGTPFHRIAWKDVVEDVFGHAPHYLLAHDGGAIRGVLPLFAVRGLRAGRVVLSVPYAGYGGVCATDPAAHRVLLDAARALGERVGARHVELRQRFHPSPDLPTRTPFATFTRTLHPDPDETFRTIPRRRRNMVRKGARHGLEARVGWEPLDEFHALYVVHRRTLGAPPFPRRMLEAIRDRFGSAAHLLTIRHGRRLVGGVLSFLHRDRVMPHYGATLPDARDLGVADFMYWELMRRACQSGYRVFDFGDSHAGSGTWTFKRLWGFEPEPIAYQYLLVRDREPPSREPARAHPLLPVWRRLPLALTARLGPSIIRWLPLY
jgi:FemAB-related protein (PEP-CTERM system-associated)